MIMKGSAVALIAAGVVFRVYRLTSIPGLTVDEGWWGLQAWALAHGQDAAATTFSGNPLNPFLLYPMAFVHLFLAPSVLALRIVPLLSNLALLGLSFWLGRRVLGDRAAAVLTSSLAVLPAAIQIGRLGYDPCQSFLACTVVLLLALRTLQAERWIRMSLLAAGAFAAALLVHPTNVFMAPLLAVVAGHHAVRRRDAILRHRRRLAAVLAGLAILALLLLMVLKSYARSRIFLDQPWLSLAFGRLTNIHDYGEFAANFTRLLSGPEVYGVSGARPTLWIYDAVAAAVAAAVLLGLGSVLRKTDRPVDRALLTSWAVILVLVFLVGGPAAVARGLHYGIPLIVTTLAVVARVVDQGLEASPAVRRSTRAASLAVGALLLSGFLSNYVLEFGRSGGQGHRTHRTADADPKALALKRILDEAPKEGPILLVSRDLWSLHPLRYLARVHPRIDVRHAWPDAGEPGLRDALDQGRVYAVEFSDWKTCPDARGWLKARGGTLIEWAIRSPGGRDIVSVMTVKRTR
jgi:hypothetical protein